MEKTEKCFCGLNGDHWQASEHSPACDLYAPDPEKGRLGVPTTGDGWGRNRFFDIEAVTLSSPPGGGLVTIQPWTTRHNPAKGCRISMEAGDLDRLCELWLTYRNRLAVYDTVNAEPDEVELLITELIVDGLDNPAIEKRARKIAEQIYSEAVMPVREWVLALSHTLGEVFRVWNRFADEHGLEYIEDHPDIDVLIGQLAHDEFHEILARARANAGKVTSEAIPDKVHVAIIDTDTGLDAWVCETEELANSQLYQYIQESWEQEGPGGCIPEDPEEAFHTYFDQDGTDDRAEIIETEFIRRKDSQ